MDPDVGKYRDKIMKIDLKKQFEENNFVYKIEREIIMETLYSPKYHRRNSLFALDRQFNLIEIDIEKKTSTVFLNKQPMEGLGDLDYDRVTIGKQGRVFIEMDRKLQHVVVYVITLQGHEHKRYQLMKYKIDY